MTSYNERLDETLARYITYSDGFGAYIVDENAMPKLEQAITSLFKELVAEAKPDRQPPMKMGDPTKESSDLDKMIFAKKKGHNEAIDEFEQNLLKALEEV